ncbi:MAG: cell wall hydrolase [Ruminococcaceae bacterium]|nr:cell wall hydrolase [Oscillospiraceae bacterium]
MAYSDRELLARLIQCEAGGEGDNGMRGVASVVMNRVYATGGEYARVSRGGSIRNIIFQPNQFTCVKEYINGVYNSQNIYNMNPTDEHYYIADWAIAGNRLYNLGEALWFFNPYSPTCPSNFPTRVGYFIVRISEHCFYNPTSAYFRT